MSTKHPFLCPFGIFPAADGHVALAAHDRSGLPVSCFLWIASGEHAAIDRLRMSVDNSLSEDPSTFTVRQVGQVPTLVYGALRAASPFAAIAKVYKLSS